MKIMQIVPTLSSPGGGEKFVYDLSFALAEQGHQVLLISLYAGNVFFDKKRDNNNLKIIHSKKKRGFDFKTAIELRKNIVKFSPDIIHSHLNSLVTLLLTGLLHKKNIFKLFHTIHFAPDRKDQNKLLFFLDKKIFQKKRIIPIAITKNLQAIVKKEYKLRYLVPYVYNGIDVQNYSTNISIDDRNFDFISVARLAKIKNHKIMIDAINSLKKDNYSFSLLIVGDGELRSELEDYVKYHGLEQNIFFSGAVQDVKSQLIKSKCLLIPSFSEGNPISILEAMAAGLAIIATSIGGPKDIIEDNVNGFLVDPTNLEYLVKKMSEVILNPDLLLRFSKNNKEKINKFDINESAKNYVNIFNTVN